MSNNIPICIIFSFILKVASMIAAIFSLNGGLLTTFILYPYLSVYKDHISINYDTELFWRHNILEIISLNATRKSVFNHA